MNKYKNIVISGDVGTGTTTLAKSLAEKLNWKYLSAGDFFRTYHKEHNIPLWNKAEIPDEIDKRIDYEFSDKLYSEEHRVYDAHYLGWFARKLPKVLKILLVCEKEIANQRILERNHTHDETVVEIERRRVQLREKFKKLYSDDDYEDPSFFDLVIDTTKNDPQLTFSTALNRFSQGY